MGGHSSATPLIWSPGSSLCVPSSTHTTHSQLLSTVHRSWHSCALRTLAERNRLCVLWFERLNEPIEQTKTWTSGWVSEGIWNEMMECNLLDQHLAKKRCLGKCLHPRNDCRSHTSKRWKHLAVLMHDVTCWNGNNQPYTDPVQNHNCHNSQSALCKLRNIDL